MTEYRSFTEAELAKLAEMGEQATNHAVRTGALTLGRSDPEHNALGFKAEWAVADSLDLPRRRSASFDCGWDLIGPRDCTINVRYRSFFSAPLMAFKARPCRADVMVLVVPPLEHRDPGVWIVGGIWTDRFYETASSIVNRHGESWQVSQKSLIPWSEFKVLL